MTDEFEQPVLEQPIAVNDGKTDELSVAVAAEAKRNEIIIPEPIAPLCRFQLDYVMEGGRYCEKHASIDSALASVRRLKMLGVIPATSTL